MREGTGKGGPRFLVEAKLVETADRKRDFEIWARGGEACPPPPPLVRNPVKFLYSDANRGSCQTHGMEPFAKTVNGFKSIL